MKHNEKLHEWEQRFADFETSGQTVAVWCAEHQIKPHNYYYWRRRTRSAENSKTEQPIQWLSLDYDFRPAMSAPDHHISVQIGRASIQIEKGFDASLFLEVARLLQSL